MYTLALNDKHSFFSVLLIHIEASLQGGIELNVFSVSFAGCVYHIQNKKTFLQGGHFPFFVVAKLLLAVLLPFVVFILVLLMGWC